VTLFDFATKNLHLATIFYHLVAKWQLRNFVNFEPWISKKLQLLARQQDVDLLVAFKIQFLIGLVLKKLSQN